MPDGYTGGHAVHLVRCSPIPTAAPMLELLLERPRPVGELVDQLGLSQPGTSKHLRCCARRGSSRSARRPTGASTRSTPGPDRARRLARPLPAAVEREPRRARPAPRPKGLTVYGTYETYDGKPAVRFERVYPHPVERVWRP